MAFVTPTQFLQNYDYRIVGQLVEDTGVQLTYAQLLTDPTTAAILDQASGEVASYCFRGGIYTIDILNGLTGISAAYLQRLTSDIALYFIVLRRGLPIEDYPQCKNAYEVLQNLAKGYQVFDLLTNEVAGVAESPALNIETIYQQNYLANSVPYFPTPRFTINQG